MASEIRLSIDARSGLRAITDIRRSSSGPFVGRAGDRVLAAVRRAIGEEFRRGAERTDSGFRPWRKGHDFGLRKARRPPLGGTSGSLARAWQGGTGGFDRVRPLEIQLGVRLPYAAVHRGDLGAKVTVRAKRRGARGLPAMFWALGLRFGVWISPAKLRSRGLTVVARPHARANTALALIVRRALGFEDGG